MRTRMLVLLGASFSVALLAGRMSAGPSQGAAMTRSDKLPPGFAELVPQGYKQVSASFTKYGTTAAVDFVASKQFTNHHSLFFSEYHLDLTLMEKPPELVKSQERAYRLQLEKDIESSVPGTTADATVSSDPPDVKRHPWGAAITQRVVHKYMGAGKRPDEIGYSCKYVGLMVSGNVIRKFKLVVSGVPTREEADQWAEKAVNKIAMVGLLNIGQ